MQHPGEPKSFPWVGPDWTPWLPALSGTRYLPWEHLLVPLDPIPGGQCPSQGTLQNMTFVPPRFSLLRKSHSILKIYLLTVLLVPFLLVTVCCPSLSPSPQGLQTLSSLMNLSESTFLFCAREYICFEPHEYRCAGECLLGDPAEWVMLECPAELASAHV